MSKELVIFFPIKAMGILWLDLFKETIFSISFLTFNFFCIILEKFSEVVLFSAF